MRALRQAALLVVLAFVPAIGQAVYFREKISWQARVAASEMVDVKTARSWGDKAIWVDARPDNEYAEGHVPGALALNEERWDELMQQFIGQWSPEKKVVVYCSSKSCNLAGDVARRLREQAQITDVYVLTGGWEAWQTKSR